MSPPDSSSPVFTVVAFGVGGSALALVCLWLEMRSAQPVRRLMPGMLALLLGLATVVLWAAQQPFGVVGPMLALGVACLAAWATQVEELRGWVSRCLSPKLVWAVLLLVCPVFSVAYAYYSNRVEVYLDTFESNACTHLDPLRASARTDLNREIDVFNYVESPTLTEMETAILDEARYEHHVIRVAGPDFACNCHGWIFTAGRYGVASIAVDTILKDNGYVEVPSPEVGDLVIYRDFWHRVTHSGMVRLAGVDGLVLVESKWGPLGVYVHPPEATPYGSEFVYYRSARRGHELTLSTSPRASAVSGS